MPTVTGFTVDVMQAAIIACLVAVSFYVVLAVFRVYNMAHGEFVMIGGFATSYSFELGTGWVGGIIITVALCGLLAGAIAVPLLHVSKRDESAGLLFTWGISLSIVQSIRLVIGTSGVSANIAPGVPHTIFGATVPGHTVYLISWASILVVSLCILWSKGPLATHFRAVKDNPELASKLGLNTPAIKMGAFVVSAVVAGLTGVLITPLVAISPSMGSRYTVLAVLTVLTFGGGSITHVVGAAFVLAMVRCTIEYFSSPSLAVAGMFVFVFTMLLLSRLWKGAGQ